MRTDHPEAALATGSPTPRRPLLLGSREDRAGSLRRLMVQSLGIGAFYVIVIVYFSFTSPVFLSYSNAVNILSGAAVIGIVSLGQALAILSGGFDLSVGGTVPLGAVLYAVCTNEGMAFPVAVALAVLSGSAFGLVNGVIITRFGINPLIATLGTLSIATGMAFSVSDGLTKPFENPDAGFLAGTVADIPYYVLVMLALALVMHLILKRTTFGRMIYAVGGNAEASRLAGIRVELVSTSLYVLSGSLAAFGGVVVASQLLAGSPAVGSDATLQTVTAVILGGAALTGGVGGIPGTLVGVLLLGTIANGLALQAVPPFYQQIATGCVLLIAVGFSRLKNSLTA